MSADEHSCVCRLMSAPAANSIFITSMLLCSAVFIRGVCWRSVAIDSTSTCLRWPLDDHDNRRRAQSTLLHCAATCSTVPVISSTSSTRIRICADSRQPYNA